MKWFKSKLTPRTFYRKNSRLEYKDGIFRKSWDVWISEVDTSNLEFTLLTGEVEAPDEMV